MSLFYKVARYRFYDRIYRYRGHRVHRGKEATSLRSLCTLWLNISGYYFAPYFFMLLCLFVLNSGCRAPQKESNKTQPNTLLKTEPVKSQEYSSNVVTKEKYPLPDLYPSGIRVSHVKKIAGLLNSCGCALQFPEDRQAGSDRVMFINRFKGDATMNIDGRDVRLKPMKNGDSKQKRKIGESFLNTYHNELFDVGIEFTVTDLCLRTNCDLVYYNAVVTVIRGAQEERINTFGVCGCP